MNFLNEIEKSFSIIEKFFICNGIKEFMDCGYKNLNLHHTFFKAKSNHPKGGCFFA